MRLVAHIHFELHDGSEDEVVVEGRTLEELQERADFEVTRRGGKNAWCYPLTEEE